MELPSSAIFLKLGLAKRSLLALIKVILGGNRESMGLRFVHICPCVVVGHGISVDKPK